MWRLQLAPQAIHIPSDLTRLTVNGPNCNLFELRGSSGGAGGGNPGDAASGIGGSGSDAGNERGDGMFANAMPCAAASAYSELH